MAQLGDRYHGHWRYCDQCQAADRKEPDAKHCAKGAELKASDERVQAMRAQAQPQRRRRW